MRRRSEPTARPRLSQGRPPSMTDLGYAAALLLAALFAWAAIAKLSSPGRTRQTFAAFGLPAPRVLGAALPVAELALAVGLVALPAVAAYVALGLLAAFTTFLVRAARGGADVGCGCFGSARAEPVGRVELLRNGLMACAALVASFATEPRIPSPSAVLLVLAATAVASLGLAALRRRAPRAARPR